MTKFRVTSYITLRAAVACTLAGLVGACGSFDDLKPPKSPPMRRRLPR